MEDMIDGSFLTIDENRLDEEWLGQPKLYFEWAKKAADARRDFDDAKNGLEVVKSEVSLEVRSDPEKFGVGTKLTEKIVDAVIMDDVRVAAAMQKVNDARHVFEIMAGAVSALDNRKTALVKLVDLRLSDYFSEPRASKESREGVEEMTKSTTRRRGRVRRSDDDD